MRRQLNTLFAFFLLFSMVGLDAQVEFKVTMDEQQQYQLTMRSLENWEGVNKLTSTGQVTFVVPTGGFDIANLKSVNGTWAFNSRVAAPAENPGHDYLTIGLVSLGTDAIVYKADKELVLFTFENTGECTGPLELMTAQDPFMYPNSQSINVGNQLTTLGSGNTNAWTGNYGKAAPDCTAFEGGVEFVLEQEGDLFNVSLIPSQNWDGVKGLTSTGQVTIVVPAGGFEIGDVINHNGVWLNNATFTSPAENQEAEYFTFGLSSLGTNEIAYVADQKELLFSFTNSGECQGEIALVEQNDAFINNSLNVNIGNQITTLGSGNRNAWEGNNAKLEIVCEDCGENNVETCTGVQEPVVICAEFCKIDPSYQITNFTSQLGGQITKLNETCIRYTPLNSMEMNTIDNLVLTGCNAEEECREVNAVITVGCGGSMVAINDYAEVKGGQSVTLDVTSNDGNTNGGEVNICMAAETAPTHGTITVNNDGTITYKSNANFVGQDQFSYTVCNGGGATASAVVYVSVTAGDNNGQATQQVVSNEVRLNNAKEVKNWLNTLEVTNVFTPNEDGTNDVWTIPAVTGVTPNISIFDRLGNMVYESKEANGVDGWNGQLYNSNKSVGAGTYFYTIKMEVEGETITKTGFVELRR